MTRNKYQGNVQPRRSVCLRRLDISRILWSKNLKYNIRSQLKAYIHICNVPITMAFPLAISLRGFASPDVRRIAVKLGRSFDAMILQFLDWIMRRITIEIKLRPLHNHRKTFPRRKGRKDGDLFVFIRGRKEGRISGIWILENGLVFSGHNSFNGPSYLECAK